MNGVIVNIRPDAYRERFHQAFGPIGWKIVDSPVLTPEPLRPNLPEARNYDAMIFTSQVAVEILRDAHGWKDKIAYAVGPATADAARRAGFSRTEQTGLDSKDLIVALAQAPFQKAFYPSAEDVSADISLDDPLRIHRLAVYRMGLSNALSEELLKELQSGRPIIVPLFSRRSALSLERLLQEAEITAQNTALSAVAISADILAPAAGPWQQRVVADKPTLEAVVATTAAMIAQLNSEAPR